MTSIDEIRRLEIEAFRALIERTLHGTHVFPDSRAPNLLLTRLEFTDKAERCPPGDRITMLGIVGYTGGDTARAILSNWSAAAAARLAEAARLAG